MAHINVTKLELQEKATQETQVKRDSVLQRNLMNIVLPFLPHQAYFVPIIDSFPTAQTFSNFVCAKTSLCTSCNACSRVQ